jgi:HSP20 family protein
MLMRFDPFREFDRLTDQAWSAVRSGVRSVPLDAYRHGDKFFIHLDLPGVDPDSIELTVEKNVLTIKAERSWTPAEGDEVLVSERPRGVFSRQLFLGETLDTDRIEAGYDHGVLTVTIPVAEQAKPRRVEVSTGAGHQLPA